MRKYLKEIRLSGLILMIIGVVMYRLLGMPSGYVACGIGILLWLIEVVYKAFHWQEYRRDNQQNIWMMLLIILLLFITMLIATR